RGLEIGADDFITKPFSAKFLSSRVKNLIDIREKLKVYYQRNMIFSHKKFDPASLDKKFIEKIEKIIYENLDDEDFNTETLAKKMALSRTQLYRKILAITNTPASEFIRTIKLNKAASLLTEGDKTVSEVAYLTGFRDPSHFTKTFLKQFGCTPSKFINPV
ncbi:MAG: DNA-binding response regulator, partial [Bacteroidota bacterium]